MNINLMDQVSGGSRSLGFTPKHFALIALCVAMLVVFTIVTNGAHVPNLSSTSVPASTLSYDQVYQQASLNLSPPANGQVAGRATILPRGPAPQ